MTTLKSSVYSAERASRSVADAANSASDKISAAVSEAQTAAQEQYDKLAAAIQRKPLEAVGIAAGVGFFLALVARR